MRRTSAQDQTTVQSAYPSTRDGDAPLEGALGFDRTAASTLITPYTSLLPIRESGFTQTGPGRFEIKGRVLSAGCVRIGRLELSVPTSAYVVPEDGWLAFLLPLAWKGDYRFNGQAPGPGRVFLSSSPDGYFSSGGARTTLGGGVRQRDFAEALAALRGLDAERVDVRDGVLDLTPAAAASLRETILGVLGSSAVQGGHERDAAFSAHLEETLIGALVDAYGSARVLPEPERRFVPAATVARRAEDYLRSATSGRVTMAGLCAATGVGTTALNAAFHEVHGVPPLRLLRLRRLMQLREALLRSDRLRSAVKRAAIGQGFTESGRLARSYVRLFGELPSETLGRG